MKMKITIPTCGSGQAISPRWSGGGGELRPNSSTAVCVSSPIMLAGHKERGENRFSGADAFNCTTPTASLWT